MSSLLKTRWELQKPHPEDLYSPNEIVRISCDLTGTKNRIRTSIDRPFLDLSGEPDSEALELPAFVSPESTHKLANAVTRLQGPMGNGHYFDYSEISDPKDDVVDQAVAKIGREIFELLIPSADAGRFLSNLKIDVERSELDVRPIVVLAGQAIRIPWNLLYFKDLPALGPVDKSGFLGFHKAFVNQPDFSDGNDRGNPLAWEAKEANEINLGYLWDEEFLAQPNISGSWSTQPYGFIIDPLDPPLDGSVESYFQSKEILQRFIQKSRPLVHFDSHGDAKTGDDVREAVEFGLRINFKAKRQVYSDWKFKDRRATFAVLNICYSAKSYFDGLADSDDVKSIAEILVEHGMCGVIAPYSKVTLTLCMELSKAFYRRVARGMRLFDAFEAAQRELMAERGFAIAALNFTLFGEHDFLMAPSVLSNIVPFDTSRKSGV